MRHCGNDIIVIEPYISIKIMKVRAEKTDDKKSEEKIDFQIDNKR